MTTTTKPVLLLTDIRQRYACAKNRAYRYIREIKAYNGGGALPGAKVTATELERWETRNIKNN